MSWLVWATTLLAAAEPFVDRAAELELDFVHFNGMSGDLYYSEMVGSGAAFVDYDLDGDLDIYLVQGGMLGKESVSEATFAPRYPLPLTDRLYRNDLSTGEDGRVTPRFVDVTEGARIESLGYGMGVTVGDIDNDGDPDLYISNAGGNQMFRNNGDGSFTDITLESGTGDRGWGVSAAFMDYDRDGWLDLYVGNYVEYRLATDKECVSEAGARDYCGPLAYEPQLDQLYHNKGDGTFEDATSAAGIDVERPGGALGVVASDFNLDGWVDIYVANDQVPNQLWTNLRDGTFVNDALLAGCAVNEDGVPEASMGLVVGDLNGDGSDDLFMSHLTRETNTLFLNDGTGMFQDFSSDSGLGMASWQYTGFGVALFDFDLDGWLDIFVANGAVKLIEELARRGDSHPIHQPNQLYRALGEGRFEVASEQGGAFFELSEVSRGVSVGDMDNDGDPDFVVSNNAGPVRLAENMDASGRPWLGVNLRPAASGRSVVGTRSSVVKKQGHTLWRRFGTDGSYASALDPRMLFGLGDGGVAERLRVFWSDGSVSEWQDLPANVLLTLWAPSGTRVR